MRDSLSVLEQVRILRSGIDVATWSLERLGLPPEWRDTNLPANTERCQEAVDLLFTLTRAEIESELAALGLQPEQLGHVLLESGSRDGHYFVPHGDVWEIYYQEREGRWVEAIFDDLVEARTFLLNLWLPVWLDPLLVTARTRDGKRVTRL